MHAVVVSFDHLHLGMLGCYGNDWIETPHLDRLATESVVFDQHFGENLDRDGAEPGWWTGRIHPSSESGDQPLRRTWLADLLRSGGVHTRLLLESDAGDSSVVAPGFDDLVTVTVTDDSQAPETQGGFARLVAVEARHGLQTSGTGGARSLLWLKSRGVPSPWIPPREFVDLYFDELGLSEHAEPADAPDDLVDPADDAAGHAGAGGIDDLPAVEKIESRHTRTSAADVADSAAAEDPLPAEELVSPEELDARYSKALYAGYVTYLDRWLGKLFQLMEQSPHRDQVLLIVVAGAGESLGEHGALGAEQTGLYEELIHAPLFVRVPHSDQAGTRRSALVQPADVGATLLDWFGISCPPASTEGRSLLPLINNELDSVRDAAYVGVAGRVAGIRTQNFFYVRGEPSRTGLFPVSGRLFEKPSDRWDMVDVAAQYPEAVDELEARLASH